MKLDFNKILNEAIYQISTDKAFAAFFTSMAPLPSSWPKSIAKELAEEFYAVLEAKTMTAAMVKVNKAAELLPRTELSDNYEVALAQITEAINYGIGLEVAKKINESPEKVHEIIKNVNMINSLDNSFDLLSVLDEIAAESINKIRKGTNLVRINGFPFISDALGGFNEGRIGLVVAGSGVGKTTFVLNLILSAIKTMPTLFVNMEMTREDIAKRLVCINNRTSLRELEKNEESIKHNFASMFIDLTKSKNFFITDGRSLTLQQITSSIYKRASDGVKLIVIDYDQKIKSDLAENEWMTVLKSIEGLEEVAKATKTHIIVLAQGDENNNPKASKRSIQPCSYVLALYEDGGKYFLESKKNRFGHRFKLEMNADFSKFKISEGKEVNDKESELWKLI
jgi:Replicative DNA helicase